MTTIIATPNYLLADHRGTITIDDAPETFCLSGNGASYITDQQQVYAFDDTLKIYLVDNKYNFYYKGARLIAYTGAGNTAFFNELKSTLEFLKNGNDLLSLVKCYYGTHTPDIVFYLDDGSCIVVKDVNGKRDTKYFSSDNNYSVVIGSGGAAKHALDIDHGQFRELQINDAYSIIAVTDKHSSLSYSVFGRRENILYTVVSEPVEEFTKRGLELRQKLSKLLVTNQPATAVGHRGQS